MASFCDWDSDQRRCNAMSYALARASSVLPASTSAPRTVAAASPTQTADPVVVIDVTDSAGVHRSIEVRPGDVPQRLAHAYASMIPGGISAKQQAKLVGILEEAMLTHFGAGVR